VRQAALVRSRTHGQLLVRDVEVAHGKLAPRDGETPLSSSHLDAVLAGAAAEGGFSPDWVSGACSATKSLSSLLAERAGADRTLDLNPLLDTLLVVEQACKNALPDATFAETAGAEVAGGAPKAALSITGEIGSRQDALMLVDKIISYFERNEPSNPAPLLLKRAKRLMTMNFVDIIKDLVPDGMDRIQTITGISREE
jgi:type VI secretion system protein ImpA